MVFLDQQSNAGASGSKHGTCLLLRDNAISVLVEDHEGELQLVVLARPGEVGQRYHELAYVYLSRSIVVEQLEHALALRRWVHLYSGSYFDV